MKDNLINIISLMLKDENEVNKILKPILKPLILILLKEIKPYIYLSLIFVFISFLLHLGIFILIIRNK